MRTTPVAQVLQIRRGHRLHGGDPPPASVFVNLELAEDTYAGVPCWSGGGAYWAHVTVAAADLQHLGYRGCAHDTAPRANSATPRSGRR
ncbi:hypothetical protein MAHJHV59_49500 [Mycobacterium avium subsp. hominissuis]